MHDLIEILSLFFWICAFGEKKVHCLFFLSTCLRLFHHRQHTCTPRIFLSTTLRHSLGNFVSISVFRCTAPGTLSLEGEFTRAYVNTIETQMKLENRQKNKIQKKEQQQQKKKKCVLQRSEQNRKVNKK